MHNLSKKTANLRELLGFPAIVSVVTLFIAVIFSAVQTKIGWIPLTAAVLCFLATYVVTLLVVGMQYRPLCLGLLEQVRDSVTGAVDPDRIGIIDNDGLVAIEVAKKYSDIWLITNDLAEDVPSAPYFRAVHRNLCLGTNYTYFCPRLACIEGRVALITKAHGVTKGSLHFRFLPEDFFFLTTRLDFTIYDPFNVQGKRCGYMGLPIDTDGHLHGRIDNDLIDSLVGKLAPYGTQEEEL